MWRTELTSVAIGGDDLHVGVKSQTNLEIAGFLRKVCRYCTIGYKLGVEHFVVKGDLKSYQFHENSEY